ncbi:MAG: hypothetical protein AAB214_02280 [Fibrobacterota bacterium]
MTRAIPAFLLTAAASFAAVPVAFTSGTPAKADDVNKNFISLDSAIQKKADASLVSVLQTAVAGKADQASLAKLSDTVKGKADQTKLDDLTKTVNDTAAGLRSRISAVTPASIGAMPVGGTDSANFAKALRGPGLVWRAYSADSKYGAFYGNTLSPTTSNYALAALNDGTRTYLNGTEFSCLSVKDVQAVVAKPEAVSVVGRKLSLPAATTTYPSFTIPEAVGVPTTPLAGDVARVNGELLMQGMGIVSVKGASDGVGGGSNLSVYNAYPGASSAWSIQLGTNRKLGFWSYDSLGGWSSMPVVQFYPDGSIKAAGPITGSTVVTLVKSSDVADYVFEPDYKLASLSEVEAFTKANKHLPEVPSAADIEKNGMDLAKMNLLLLKKVEELTLHTIELEKRIKAVEVSTKP